MSYQHIRALGQSTPAVEHAIQQTVTSVANTVIGGTIALGVAAVALSWAAYAVARRRVKRNRRSR